jgi:hypothetical protein
MSIGYCTLNSLFCLFVMIRSFDLHLNRHFIDTYSVGVFFAYGTFRLDGNPQLSLRNWGL